MSEDIPLEIQVEIIKRLPVRTLLQFRSVSKPWKALIDSSEFISAFKVREIHPHRLLVWYKDVADNKEKYVRFVDDDDDEAFSQQELSPSVPLLSKFINRLKMVGSSQGLLCLYGYYQDPGHRHYESAIEMVVLWNPSIRKSVCIAVPGLLGWSDIFLGFGVCPFTNDPTIVKITYVSSMYFGMADSSPRVEVFTLSRGSWRVLTSNLPRKSAHVTRSNLCLGSYIYWVAFGTDAGSFIRKNLIVSFDMTTQEFREIDLPKSLATATISISKVCDSLAVLEYITHREVETGLKFQVCSVWIMDHTVPNSFTKLFTINKQCATLKILGFTKRGQPIMETQGDYVKPAALVVYEPSSEHINDTGIYGKEGSLFVSSYMETLLLVDHPDCSVLF